MAEDADREYKDEQIEEIKEERKEKKEVKNQNNGIDGIGYILFLVLILLLLGNQNTFSQYFELLNEQTSRAEQMLNMFAATANGLESTIMTPQNVKDNG